MTSLNSCQKPIEQQTLITKPSFKFNQPNKLEISYEIENLSFSQVEKPKQENASDFIYTVQAMPIVDRQEVKLKLFEDGNSEYIIKQLEPTIKIPSRKNPDALPDNTPRSVMTRITSNTAFFYDKEGKLLSQYKMPEQYLKDITSKLKNPEANLVTINMMQNGVLNVEALSAEAQKQGAIVSKLPDNLITIRYTTKKANYAGTTYFRENDNDDIITVNMYNSKSNLLMGSRVYDKKETLLMQSYCKYKKLNGKIDLDMVYVEKFSTDTNGRKVKAISNIYFRNLIVVKNS